MFDLSKRRDFLPISCKVLYIYTHIFALFPLKVSMIYRDFYIYQLLENQIELLNIAFFKGILKQHNGIEYYDVPDRSDV